MFSSARLSQLARYSYGSYSDCDTESDNCTVLMTMGLKGVNRHNQPIYQHQDRYSVIQINP